MGRRGKYKRKWKRRDRPKDDRRDSYQRKREGAYRKGPARRKPRQLHHFPEDSQREKSRHAERNAPRYMNIEPGVVGIVERGMENSENRRFVTGLIVAESRDRSYVHVYFQRNEPLYVFSLLKGVITEEPDAITDDGNYFALRNYPDPVFHRSFISKDPQNPNKAFAPHCRNVAKHRVKEMMVAGMEPEGIRKYEAALDEFLRLSGELFRAQGDVDE